MRQPCPRGPRGISHASFLVGNRVCVLSLCRPWLICVSCYASMPYQLPPPPSPSPCRAAWLRCMRLHCSVSGAGELLRCSQRPCCVVCSRPVDAGPTEVPWAISATLLPAACCLQSEHRRRRSAEFAIGGAAKGGKREHKRHRNSAPPSPAVLMPPTLTVSLCCLRLLTCTHACNARTHMHTNTLACSPSSSCAYACVRVRVHACLTAFMG